MSIAIMTVAAIMIAVHTRFPQLKKWICKEYDDIFKQSGWSISNEGRQSAPPPTDWIFRGLFDNKTNEKLDPTDPQTATTPREIRADFLAVGYVQATDNQLKIGGCGIDFHFLLTDQQQNKSKLIAFFENTREGGVTCTNNCKGYKRQFHSFNTHQEDKALITEAVKNGYLLKIRGRVFLMDMTINAKKYQKIHFKGFDDRVTCPTIIIDKIEVIT